MAPSGLANGSPHGAASTDSRVNGERRVLETLFN
jgi:hypothetical protein